MKKMKKKRKKEKKKKRGVSSILFVYALQNFPHNREWRVKRDEVTKVTLVALL
jgi:hypothetical protein